MLRILSMALAFVVLPALLHGAEISNPGGEFDQWVSSKMNYPVAKVVPWVPVENPVSLIPPAPPAETVTTTRRGYPVHGSMIYNVEGDWTPTREFLIKHLMTASEHRGEFDQAWLQSLSFQELYSLHDDDHLHTVKPAVVKTSSTVRTTAISKPVMVQRQMVMQSSPCPNGNCPYSTQAQTRRQNKFSVKWGAM